MKQETLEEAAERILFDNTGMLVENHPTIKQSMLDLAKWQQERSYSEEEVIKLLIYCKDRFGGSGLEDYTHDDEVKEWFQQYYKMK
jgi:hypothetical protein